MTLNEHISRVVTRSKAFYKAATPGHFLVRTQFPIEQPPLPPLNNFDLDSQLEEWLDYWLEAARPVWAAKDGLDDDTIPSICPRFGIAEHSAWLGTEVRLQENTSLPVPLLKAPEDVDRLSLSTETPWFNYMKKGYAYLRSKQAGDFVLSVRGTMSPMDVANAIRGDELFTDVMLQKDFVHDLLQFLVRAIDWYYRQLCSWADRIGDGYIFFYHSSWMPADTLGHISNDAALLCSGKVYTQFGFPYEQQLAEKFGHLFYHVHNEKMHFVPQLAQLSGLVLLEITHDPKTAAPLEDLPRILENTGRANLLLHGTSDQVREHIHELKDRNVFFDISCQDRRDAEDIITFVREY